MSEIGLAEGTKPKTAGAGVAALRADAVAGVTEYRDTNFQWYLSRARTPFTSARSCRGA
jgi:hypothetical protein